jgi:hypothetical protein
MTFDPAINGRAIFKIPPAIPAVLCRIPALFGFARFYSAFIARKSQITPGFGKSRIFSAFIGGIRQIAPGFGFYRREKPKKVRIKLSRGFIRLLLPESGR